MLGLSPAAQISPAPIPRDPTATSRHGTQAGTEARARDAQGFLETIPRFGKPETITTNSKTSKISKSSKNYQKVSEKFLAGYVSKNLGIAPGLKSRRSPGPQGRSDAGGGARCSAGEFGGSMEGCSWTFLVPQPPQLQ